jgi:diadenosine tetraphosphate (Ap4A) HIT family hydrolase
LTEEQKGFKIEVVFWVKGGFVDKKPLVANLHYGGDYKDTLKESARTGVCVFCREEFWKKKIIVELNGWIVVQNQYATKDRDGNDPEHHFLILPTRHIDNEFGSEITGDDWETIFHIIVLLQKEMKLRGGGIVMRFGDSTISGRTVLHAHIHLVVPHVSSAGAVPVYMPIG